MMQGAVRWLAFAVWAAVAASAVFWGLRLLAAGPALPPQAVPVAPAAPAPGDALRVLGGPPAAAPLPAAVPAPGSSRFALLGLVVPRGQAAAGEGLALIAVDGKPPRALRVGATVDGDLVLQRVHARGVDLGARGAAAAFSLAAPVLPPPAAGGVPAGRPLPLPRMLPAPVPGMAPMPRPTPVPVTAPVPSIQPVLPSDDAVNGEPDADSADEEETEPTSTPTPTRAGLLRQ